MNLSAQVRQNREERMYNQLAYEAFILMVLGATGLYVAKKCPGVWKGIVFIVSLILWSMYTVKLVQALAETNPAVVSIICGLMFAMASFVIGGILSQLRWTSTPQKTRSE